MIDDFEDFNSGLTSPATAAETIVPSDTDDLAHVTRAVFVGQSGNLAVTLLEGDEATFMNVQAGVVYPLRVLRVRATGTTAMGIVGLR